MRLNISSQDKKALEVFFTNRTYQKDSDYMKLAESWKSTTEISKELNETRKRALQRLEKLSGFGFIQYFAVDYHGRIDRYWAIDREGVYYIMATLDGGRLVSFLRSNNRHVREFSDIEQLVLKRNVQVRYLTSQIINIVKNYQYYLLKNFIDKWRNDNIRSSNWMHAFFHPSMKNTLKKVYGKDKEMMEKLSHLYGRID